MARDVGIDLGTSNVLIFVEKSGIVLNEPSVLAIDKNTNEVLAVGLEAYEMLGRTPANIKLLHPLVGGVISDFKATETMLRAFLDKINVSNRFSKPNILVCCPTNLTSIEQKAIIEACEAAGGKNVYLEEEPKVAAVGSGVDIFQPAGNMVIDIGGGTSDIAVLSMGQIVTSYSSKVAGDSFDQDIIAYIKDKFKLMIGKRTAEDLKKAIAVVTEPEEDLTYDIRGRSMMDGLPKSVQVKSSEIRDAIRPSVKSIALDAKNVLERTSPELSADIIDHGIILTGGGALIEGVAELYSDMLDVPVSVSDQPLFDVALGTEILLKHVRK